MDALYNKFEKAGHTGRPSEASAPSADVDPGDYRDMKDFMTRDEHGTREAGITEDERRARILKKYGR